MFRYVASVTSLMRVFIMNECLILSNAASQRYQKAVFPFSFVLSYFQISSSICSLTHFDFLVAYCFHFPHFSSYNCFLVLYCRGWRKLLDTIPVLLNLLRVIFGLTYDLSWRTFHVYLIRMCILIFWDGMSYRYLLRLIGLMCHLRSLFPS